MVKKRTIREIEKDLEYERRRYQDYLREGHKEDANLVKQDIE